MWLADANYTAAAVNAGGMGFLTAKTFPDPIQFKDELEKALSLTSGQTNRSKSLSVYAS